MRTLVAPGVCRGALELAPTPVLTPMLTPVLTPVLMPVLTQVMELRAKLDGIANDYSTLLEGFLNLLPVQKHVRPQGGQRAATMRTRVGCGYGADTGRARSGQTADIGQTLSVCALLCCRFCNRKPDRKPDRKPERTMALVDRWL